MPGFHLPLGDDDLGEPDRRADVRNDRAGLGELREPAPRVGAALEHERHDALAAGEARRDLIVLGAYQAGSDPRTDAAIAAIDAIEDFLRQPSDHSEALEDTLAALSALT